MPTTSTRPIVKRRQTLIGNHPMCTAATMDETYEPGEVIGTGSFGIIRKVTRRLDGIVLARKELNYGRMDERDLRQLTEEVNILEQLGSNDNIVRYYERFVDKPNNMLYILMEYCEGGDLAQVIQRNRKTGTSLSEDLVWGYLTQITLALSDCHTEVDAEGRRKAVILHRDIKPENVFLDQENNLKLGDFGLSKAMAQAAMTQTYVGTPYYMSPELINGQPYDIKSDIWALGCLIYELCAGHPPFHEARTQPELAVMIREGKIPDLPRAYTPHLGQVVRAMLKQNPKHRPTTSQIKALDSVKLHIRTIELKKATKEIRIRGEQMAERESDLLAREAAVILREKIVLHRENDIRMSNEALKEAHAKLAAERKAFLQTASVPRAAEDRENERPAPLIDGDLLARVAQRPSLVPRRPLEERRGSGGTSIPFPRLSSTSSLMSLDDTPIKVIPPTSLRRRLASKSMYDLSAAGSFPLNSPSRAISSAAMNAPSQASLAIDSPMSVTSFGRRSETAASPSKTAPPATSFRPLPPPSCPSTVSPTLPSASNSPSTNPYDGDDFPSPFLKKTDGSRFPSSANLPPKAATVSRAGAPVPARASRISLGSKPSMVVRLLATRASAAAGVDEVGRRISGVRARAAAP